MDVNNTFQMILLSFRSAWNAVYSWFNSVLTATHAKDYVIAIIIAMFVIRFLVYPFFKGGVAGSSDSVYNAYKLNPGTSDKVNTSNIGTEKRFDPSTDTEVWTEYKRLKGWL